MYVKVYLKVKTVIILYSTKNMEYSEELDDPSQVILQSSLLRNCAASFYSLVKMSKLKKMCLCDFIFINTLLHF